MFERLVRRYSAYHFRWCQAFGAHHCDFDEEHAVNWLYGEDRIGVILAPHLRKNFLREVLGVQRSRALLTLTRFGVVSSGFKLMLELKEDKRGIEKVTELLTAERDIHMFLTSHLFYQSGARIVTLSRKKPMVIMYKEIDPIKIRIV